MTDEFGGIQFSGNLRPSQVASSSVIKKDLEDGSKELLIVAPPGSGKTVLGLYVWSDLVRKPALVLSPNSAIQAQWIERAKELFHLDGRESEIGTDPKNPGILTSLTYQSVTLPKRGGGGSGRFSTGDVDLETDDSIRLRSDRGGRYGERHGMDQ